MVALVLPDSRNTTYTPGTPVKSADLNDIQDMIANKRKPLTWRAGLPIMFGGSSWTAPTLSQLYLTSTGSTSSQFTIPCEEGDEVTNFELQAAGDGAADVAYVLHMVTMTGSVILANFTDSNRGASFGTVVFPITPRVLVAGEALVLTATPSGGTARMGIWRCGYRR